MRELVVLLPLCCCAAAGAHAVTARGTAFAVRHSRGREIHVTAARTATDSLFPMWPPEAIAGRRELSAVVEAFEQVTIGVPLKASSEAGDGYRAWLDGGFAAHRFINQKISRQTYVPILVLLLQLMVGIQARYPDLYAVLKFVPKKNGLNPLLASLQARRRARTRSAAAHARSSASHREYTRGDATACATACRRRARTLRRFGSTA
jgi:hypothetical protein